MTSPAEQNADALNDQGEHALRKAQETGEVAHFDEAIRLLQSAIDVAPPTWWKRPWVLTNIGSALQIRGRGTGAITDLNRAVEVLEEAVRCAPSHDPQRCGVLNNLRGALSARFDLTGDNADLDRAIDVLEEAATSTPTADPDRVGLFSTLRIALCSRFERAGDAADLNRALRVLELAANSTPTGSTDRRTLLLGVASVFYLRSTALGDLADLQRAIKIYDKYATTAPTDSDEASECSNFAIALQTRFERTGNAADLDRAIELLELAQAATPIEDPQWAAGPCNVAGALMARFERNGDPADLDRAVTLFEDALTDVPTEHPQRPMLLSNLAASLRTRFEHTGNPVDLDRAIDHQTEALDAIPQGHTSRPVFMSNLGDDLQGRYENIGDTADLNRAINLLEEAAETIPEDHPDRPMILGNLGVALESRFDRTQDVADLDRAIDMVTQSTDPTRPRHQHWARFISNLGNMLRRKYELSGDTDDLDAAIDKHSQAVQCTPDVDADKPTRLANLGGALLRRFERTNIEADLTAAKDACERAVATMPRTHRDRTMALLNHASALLFSFKRSGDMTEADRMLEASREAALNTAARLQYRAQAAQYWGRAATLKQDWNQALEGYRLAIELVTLAVPWELGRADQEFQLAKFAGLGSDAAAVALQAGDVESAVEMFEQGRAILFSRALHSRSDITELRENHEALADRFVRRRNSLSEPDAQHENLTTGGKAESATPKPGVKTRRAAAAEFESVVSEIRALPGFEHFLAPRKIDDLLSAADQGPVVLMNIAALRSDALVITSGGVESIPLPDVGPVQVAAQTSKFLYATNVIEDQTSAYDAEERQAAGDATREVLAWLADNLTTVVLNHLGYTSTPPPGAPWPRVWWCPSGLLSLLPIHAAGRHPAPSSDEVDAVIDRVISSTIPTLNALLHARVTPAIQGDPRLLVVVMPDLAGAADEAATLQRLWRGQSTVLGLPGGEAPTTENVMANLVSHPCVHYACHGYSNLVDPSASHLFLADGAFTVTDLARIHLPDAQLAFLSACTTAQTGIALPDEPIHMAAACQLAGYRNVVASLWAISDNATVALADTFYSGLIAEHRGDPAAALHHATRQVRDEAPERPHMWAPYIHIGP